MANIRQPAVFAKDLRGVALYNLKPPFLHLDAAPFTLSYLLLLLRCVQHLFAGTWSTATELKYIFWGLLAAQVLVKLFAHWFVEFRCFLQFIPAKPSLATHVKVTPAEFTGHKEIVKVDSRQDESGDLDLSFEFRKQRYCYLEAENAFTRLQFPDKETFEHYWHSSGYTNDSNVLAALEKWGPNKFVVPLPSFREMLLEQLLAPFFVFQTFCVGLWCMDEYWYYSLFTLGMLVTFECTVVFQRIRQLKELRSLQTPRQPLQVYRHGKWDRLPGEALLPGDVISVVRPTGAGSEDKVVPADVLLLAGTCIVEEAVLTGESTPQWKVPIAAPLEKSVAGTGRSDQPGELDPNARLNVTRDKNQVLFSGTKVLQHTPDKGARIRTPDGGCLAVVLRTGFETSQGQLMRTILYSTERVTGNNWETGIFILFLLVFAVAASGYVLYYGLQDPDRSRFKLFLNCTMIITSVIPPELPMELSIAVNTSLLNLARKAVFCTEPFRIPMAGKVAICCFDKTGTLTSDNMMLEGLSGVPGAGEGLLREVKNAPKETQRVLACCQALIQVDGDLVGDPLERAAFEAVGWMHTAGSVTSSKQEGGGRETVAILHRFHFSSALKRMSAIVRVDSEGGNDSEMWALTKGAPEVIKDFLEEAPANYDAAYREFAAQGGRNDLGGGLGTSLRGNKTPVCSASDWQGVDATRQLVSNAFLSYNLVIALAHKRLASGLTASQLREVPREEVERGLEFGGFAVLQCPLKPESEPSLRMLRDSSHCLVMITGDAPLTACHAASRVHIVDRRVLILTARDEGKCGHKHDHEEALTDGHFFWLSPDGSVELPFSRDPSSALEIASQYDLCVSGDGLAHLHKIRADTTYVPLAQVFARVSPDQKELILRVLRGAGWVTLMCGDGTNDVGALKTAHVGVALLSPKERKKEVAEEGAKGGAPRGGPGRGAATGRGRGREAAAGRGAASSATGRGSGAASPAAKQAAGGKSAAVAVGPGAKMLDEMRKKGKPIDPKMEQMAAWLDGLAKDTGDMGDAPMVKPGDASMASPFTAKAGNVMPCTDIIKQGRSTLVTTVQMFKILGLLCLSTAYSLSVMYLQGVKVGDLQATAQGFLSAYMFFVISNGKPLERLSRERPHPSIFCAYVFLSVVGQFALHMVFLIYMYDRALRAMPQDHVQKPDAEFEPNLVNTVCFLVQWVVQLTTFAVNYIGHPFNQSLVENTGLALALRWGMLGFVVATINLVPYTDWALSLVPLPTIMKAQLLALAFLDFSLAQGWEVFLRKRFPAVCPPQKGYLAYKGRNARQQESKKDQ